MKQLGMQERSNQSALTKPCRQGGREAEPGAEMRAFLPLAALDAWRLAGGSQLGKQWGAKNATGIGMGVGGETMGSFHGPTRVLL